jgi:SSS family solute:Na+ symporter
MEEYFVAGRSLPWWIAGVSLAATWFASDAPLAAASLVRQKGIFGNWLWWYEAGGLMMLVFFYAKLWRRANIITDAEFMEMRYSGKAGTALRGISAIYHGVLRNCVVMGWVMLAMIKFAQVLLGWDMSTTLFICGIVAVIYTFASGLWGVVMTDMFQFITGLAGSTILAGIVLYNLGGPSGMVEAISNLKDAPPGALDMIPNTEHSSALEFASYMCLIFVLWMRSGHDGYSGQRIFATKNDKHAMLTALLWGILAVAVMTWPWIIVGLGSLVIFPISEASEALAADPELAYPMMLAELMPIGLKGMLVASFLAAFMSTMDTHLCWGGSYLVNDIYKRFIKKDATEKHYVLASRLSILVLVGFAILTAMNMTSIEKAWIYLIDLTAGLAGVWLLRWYWWRVNGWSEISAIGASLIFANGGLIAAGFHNLGMSDSLYEPIRYFYAEDFGFVRAVCILVATTIVWVTVAILTKPDNEATLNTFYRKVRPGGWWGDIAKQNPDIQPDESGSKRWFGWFLGVLFIYSGLLGIGNILTAKTGWGIALLMIAFASGYGLFKTVDFGEKESVAPN